MVANNQVEGISTSTPTIGSVLTYSGTLGNFVGGTSGTFGIANGAVTNAMLANSTISGISLGSNLNSLSNDGATLTGTSYNGSASVSNWAINLAHGNSWTALQQFTNATSTLFTAGNIYDSGLTSGDCVQASTAGLLVNTSGACGSVTSVALSGGTTGLTVTGSPITTSGTLTLGGTLGIGNGGTGATSLSSGLSSASSVLHNVINPSFTELGTTTTNTITGTTTIPLEIAYGETWNYAQCSVQPNGATLDVDFYYHANNTTHILPFIIASSTAGKITFTSNNVPTNLATTSVDVGTPTGSPTSIACTVNITN